MKVLVTGVKGQLGYDVCKQLAQRNIEHKGVDIADFDLTNREQTINYIVQYAPTIVVHCAAYTAVDRAEEDKDLCYKVNVEGTRYIAEACKQLGATMMYFSTDYVFDGSGNLPWKENDTKGALNVYGLTKGQGEDEVMQLLQKYFVLRISWVFGYNGNNFVKTMMRLGKEKQQLNIVNDQVGSPTYTADLAVLVCDMLATDKYGVYHVSNEGYCSWAEFASKIMEYAHIQCEVKPILTAQYPTKALRPLNSRLDKSKLTASGFEALPTWQDALYRYIKNELGE